MTRIRHALLLLLLAGCTTGQRDTLVQYSTINALLAGVYDGDLTFRELRRHGDFGIGTFNELDGEMVALDGRYLQITANGTVKPVRDDMRTPFAVVTHFNPETTIVITNELCSSELEQTFDVMLPDKNAFYAIKVTAHFSYMKARSVPRQQHPYPPLVEAARHQTVFEFRDVRGTLVGFRAPEHARGVNVPGYHFHFLTADRQAGGHVLDCRLDAMAAQIQRLTDILMLLPKHGTLGAEQLLKTHDTDLETVEKSR